jgi:hypothetical protein
LKKARQAFLRRRRAFLTECCRYIVIILSVYAVAGPVSGHHGNSAYDETTAVKIKGVVTKFDWSNPHIYIYLDLKNSDGTITHWTVESLSPERMTRMGWDKNSVRPGDYVAITLSAAKDGSPIGYLARLVFADGRELKTREGN